MFVQAASYVWRPGIAVCMESRSVFFVYKHTSQLLLTNVAFLA